MEGIGGSNTDSDIFMRVKLSSLRMIVRAEWFSVEKRRNNDRDRLVKKSRRFEGSSTWNSSIE